MKIDSYLPRDDSSVPAAARAIEAAGFGGVWAGESRYDPFLRLLQVADATTRLTLGTSIAIAFARTPMTTAHTAYDLASYSQGRFVLGLGTQVRPHVERRFSMPWSHPAARMREFVFALRAIWACWHDGAPLDFRGDFYTHTLMTPFFSPVRHTYGPPPVYLAGVGPLMTEVAGEVAEGFFFHPFTTGRYLREITLPALKRGMNKTDRTLADFAVTGPALVAVGRDDREIAAAVAGTKAQIAFYASTPAYRPVLDLHGWGDLQPELTTMTKQGRWSELADMIDDKILDSFAVVGDPATVGRGLRERFGDVAARVTLSAPYDADPAIWPAVIAAARA